jgi:prephenate dehydrogenase
MSEQYVFPIDAYNQGINDERTRITGILESDVALYREMAFANDNPEYEVVADRLEELAALINGKTNE